MRENELWWMMGGGYLQHESELLISQNSVGVGLPVGRLQERRRK